MSSNKIKSIKRFENGRLTDMAGMGFFLPSEVLQMQGNLAYEVTFTFRS